MAKASTETRTRHTRQAAERKQTLTTLGLDGAPGQGAFKIKTQRSKASQVEPALAQSCRWTLRGGGIQVLRSGPGLGSTKPQARGQEPRSLALLSRNSLSGKVDRWEKACFQRSALRSWWGEAASRPQTVSVPAGNGEGFLWGWGPVTKE